MAQLFETSSNKKDIALVIGAGGMGAVVARRMSQRYPTIVADIDGERAENVSQLLANEGGSVAGCYCDVTSEKDVEALAKTVSEHGNIRAYVHVAGLSPSMADFDMIMRVNLVGVANVARAILPLSGPGTAAVLIASLAGHNFHPISETIPILRNPLEHEFVQRLRRFLSPDEDTPEHAYQMSKWGVIDYVRRHAANWGSRDARIVSLSPGLIATPQGLHENKMRPSKGLMIEQTPLARQGTMLEIADAVEFLVSDRASFISGTDLLVDGGLAGVMRDAQK